MSLYIPIHNICIYIYIYTKLNKFKRICLNTQLKHEQVSRCVWIKKKTIGFRDAKLVGKTSVILKEIQSENLGLQSKL